MRKLTVLMILICFLGSNIGLAHAENRKAANIPLGVLIEWQKNQLAVQRKLTAHKGPSHKKYLRYLKVHIKRNLKEWNAHSPLRLTPPHYSSWICIHGFEGSWSDPGSPYYGGLQMDIGFQSAYKSAFIRTWGLSYAYLVQGTADSWQPIVQMWVAEEAYKSRGFYPWPNTARYCHLI